MRFTRRKAHAEIDYFDLTPMIDVVMQLIIFFMFTSQFAQVIRSQIELPEQPGEKETTASEEAIIIDVQADGTLLVSGRDIDRPRLMDMISAELTEAGENPAKVRVLVRADKSAPSRYINDIAEDLARLGVRGWRLGTSRPADAPPTSGGRP